MGNWAYFLPLCMVPTLYVGGGRLPNSQIICPKDWYQPAVDVAYGPELATFWREAAIECRAKSVEMNGVCGQVSNEKNFGCLGYIGDEILYPVMWGLFHNKP